MDDFDKLFPRVAAHFSFSSLTASQWLDARPNASAVRVGACLALADTLLVRAASWREKRDLFASYRFASLFVQFQELCRIMAGSPKAPRSKYTRASWQGFVERRLSDEELAELDEWQPSAMDVFSALDSALADGYRVTLSYNPTTSLATCTLMDDDKKRKSGGYALSTSDRDCSLALKAAMFKFAYVLEKSLESLVDQPSPGGRRG